MPSTPNLFKLFKDLQQHINTTAAQFSMPPMTVHNATTTKQLAAQISSGPIKYLLNAIADFWKAHETTHSEHTKFLDSIITEFGLKASNIVATCQAYLKDNKATLADNPLCRPFIEAMFTAFLQSDEPNPLSPSGKKHKLQFDSLISLLPLIPFDALHTAFITCPQAEFGPRNVLLVACESIQFDDFAANSDYRLRVVNILKNFYTTKHDDPAFPVTLQAIIDQILTSQLSRLRDHCALYFMKGFIGIAPNKIHPIIGKIVENELALIPQEDAQSEEDKAAIALYKLISNENNVSSAIFGDFEPYYSTARVFAKNKPTTQRPPKPDDFKEGQFVTLNVSHKDYHGKTAIILDYKWNKGKQAWRLQVTPLNDRGDAMKNISVDPDNVALKTQAATCQ